MLSSVLKSDVAIEMNIAIMRVFTKLDELDHKVGELDQKLPTHSKARKRIGLRQTKQSKLEIPNWDFKFVVSTAQRKLQSLFGRKYQIHPLLRT